MIAAKLALDEAVAAVAKGGVGCARDPDIFSLVEDRTLLKVQQGGPLCSTT
jgi:hypothetical protein